MRGRTHLRVAAWSAVVAWSGLIFAASSVPGSNIPGRFGPLAHFIEYAVLGGLLLLSLRLDNPVRRAMIIAVVLASLYAVTDEFHQSFVPMRTPDPVDWVVDTAGAITGAFVAAFAAKTLHRSRETD